jgi:predicted O-methyltransferase YrrM
VATKEEFIENINRYNNDSQITVFDCDLFEVPIHSITNSIQLFFYDGPHDEKTTAEAVQYYWSCLQNEAIIVFDDANWDGVVSGANKGIEAMNGQISYKKLILNSEENPNEWWNGLYIVVVRKS